MKIKFLIPVLLLTALSASSQQKFKVSGKITGANNNGKVFLEYEIDGDYKKDSAIVTKGEFNFSGSAKMPLRATLELKPTKPENPATAPENMALPDYHYQVFFLEQGITNVTGKDIRTARITGGKAQQDFNNLNVQLKPLNDQSSVVSQNLMKLWQQGNTSGRPALLIQATSISSSISRIEEEFILSHPESYVSLSLLQSRVNYLGAAKFKTLYNALSASIKDTETGKKLRSKLEIALKTDVGSPAIYFTQNTPDQKPFSLSSLKGKYVLIDFWASWCGPCRGENPFLKEAYTTFKEKNFEIVSVSLDETKAPWLTAIKTDGLPWIHVSDLKGWKNEVAIAYGITSIPRNFLIAPDGTIIGQNLRGEEMMKKLEELMKN